MDIKIPFLGDGIESANVVAILVQPGDAVDVDQTVLELETDKATAPVPSLSLGTVDQVIVKEGDVVKEGMVVVKLTGASTDAPKTVESSKPVSPAPVTPLPKKATPLPEPSAASYDSFGDISQVNAQPSIKTYAHLSGLDISRIQGTGHGGRVTWDDVRSFVAFLQSKAFSEVEVATETKKPAVKPPIDFSKFGPIETLKLTSLRQKISSHLSHAWNDIPHVTQFADIQIDHVMALRKTLNAKQKKNEIKLSVTVFILKAMAETLKSFDQFNASLNGDDELILKKYYHLGVAVDTDSGLVVPVIRDVDKKSLQEIAVDLDALAQKARDKQLSLEDIQGATFTLSNLGGLGASHFTPIVNSPEVAILGTGKANFVAKLDDKTREIANHLMMPVALSYDHRVIDGADGARFVKTLTQNIESFDKKWVK
jgi:pyruvate dehydrogenase E2 component (dihydrolipoamide acetyltransferase)